MGGCEAVLIRLLLLYEAQTAAQGDASNSTVGPLCKGVGAPVTDARGGALRNAINPALWVTICRAVVASS